MSSNEERLARLELWAWGDNPCPPIIINAAKQKICPFDEFEQLIIGSLSHGMECKIIAIELNITFNALVKRIVRMRDKTRTKNTTELVSKSLREGWIK